MHHRWLRALVRWLAPMILDPAREWLGAGPRLRDFVSCKNATDDGWQIEPPPLDFDASSALDSLSVDTEGHQDVLDCDTTPLQHCVGYAARACRAVGVTGSTVLGAGTFGLCVAGTTDGSMPPITSLAAVCGTSHACPSAFAAAINSAAIRDSGGRESTVAVKVPSLCHWESRLTVHPAFNEFVADASFAEAVAMTWLSQAPGIVPPVQCLAALPTGIVIRMPRRVGDAHSVVMRGNMYSVAHLLWSTFAALGAMHLAGCVHGDIKPQNIVLTRTLAVGPDVAQLRPATEFIDLGSGGSLGLFHHVERCTVEFQDPVRRPGEVLMGPRGDVFSVGRVAMAALLRTYNRLVYKSKSPHRFAERFCGKERRVADLVATVAELCCVGPTNCRSAFRRVGVDDKLITDIVERCGSATVAVQRLRPSARVMQRYMEIVLGSLFSWTFDGTLGESKCGSPEPADLVRPTVSQFWSQWAQHVLSQSDSSAGSVTLNTLRPMRLKTCDTAACETWDACGVSMVRATACSAHWTNDVADPGLADLAVDVGRAWWCAWCQNSLDRASSWLHCAAVVRMAMSFVAQNSIQRIPFCTTLRQMDTAWPADSGDRSIPELAVLLHEAETVVLQWHLADTGRWVQLVQTVFDFE